MRPTSTVSNESKVLMPNRTISDILSQFNPFRKGNRAIGCILTDWDTATLSNLLIHWRPLGGGTGVVEGRFRLHIIIHTHTHTHVHTHTCTHDNVMHTHCLIPRLTPTFMYYRSGAFRVFPQTYNTGNDTHTHTHRKRES